MGFSPKPERIFDHDFTKMQFSAIEHSCCTHYFFEVTNKWPLSSALERAEQKGLLVKSEKCRNNIVFCQVASV